MRDLLRAEAERGRAVLVSSHLLAEVAQVVNHVVVISRGTLRADGPLETVLGGGDAVTRVQAGEADRLRSSLAERGFTFEHEGPYPLLVEALRPRRSARWPTTSGSR